MIAKQMRVYLNFNINFYRTISYHKDTSEEHVKCSKSHHCVTHNVANLARFGGKLNINAEVRIEADIVQHITFDRKHLLFAYLTNSAQKTSLNFFNSSLNRAFTFALAILIQTSQTYKMSHTDDNSSVVSAYGILFVQF